MRNMEAIATASWFAGCTRLFFDHQYEEHIYHYSCE